MVDRSAVIGTLHAYMETLKESGCEDILLPGVPRRRIESSTSGQPQENAASKRDIILAMKKEVDRCTKCPVLVKNRTKTVFGAGHVNARLVFVGEAPGRDEDIQGIPFVGRAGQLLTKMIESIGLDRKQIFIANILNCRPPQNPNPLPEEIMNCEPYLLEQLRVIEPKIICALGSFAAKTLLKTDSPISRLRGRFHDYHGVKLLPTFHPAYLLRNPAEKKKSWVDMKMLRDALRE